MGMPIGDPTIGAALQKLLALRGRVVIGMEEFIVPTVQVADIGSGAAPAVTGAASAQGLVGAVAAEFATWRFEVPGSLVAKIQAIDVMVSGATQINASWTATGPSQAVVSSKDFTDGRLLQLGQRPAGVLTQGTQVGAIAPINWRAQLEANVGRRFEFQHWLLGSGAPAQFGFLEFQAGSVNLAGILSIEWTEYPNL